MIRFPSRPLAVGAVVALLLTVIAAFAPGPAAAAGLISIRSHNCAATYDGANASIYDLAANCHDAGAGLTITVNKDGNQVSNSVTNNNGEFNVSNFGAGGASIDQTAPLGFYNRAFCALYLDNDPNARVYYEYQDPINQVILGTQNFDCDFYNVPFVPAQPTTVYVNKHNCPTGFDAASADIYGLAGGCNEGGTDGVAFALTDISNTTTPATTAGGIAAWQNVQAGSLTIAETMPAGFVSARVFCNTKNSTGDETGFSEYTVSANASITGEAKVGYDFYCDWFDIPPATVTVTVTKYDCPATGVDPSDVASMLQLCTAFANVKFSLAPAGPSGIPTEMTTDAQGAAQWIGLPDQYVLGEELPSGYGSPSVACKIGDPATAPAQMMSPDSSYAITFTLTAGQTADCIWFNFPLPPTPTPTATATNTPIVFQPTAIVIITTPSPTQKPAGPATLAIIKYTCAPGYDLFAKSADPATDCPKTTANVQFTLTNSANVVKKQKTGNKGEVDFSNLKAGAYFLIETFPTGVTSAFIDSCDSNLRNFGDYPFTPFARIGTSGKIGLNLVAGEQLTCSWYDVPTKKTSGSGATVKITLKDCPGQSVVLSQCAAGASGVQFTLKPSSGSGQSSMLETDDAGIASGPVPPGTYALEELGGNWCLADSSAFDNNSNLVVASDDIDVAIYNCGA